MTAEQWIAKFNRSSSKYRKARMTWVSLSLTPPPIFPRQLYHRLEQRGLRWSPFDQQWILPEIIHPAPRIKPKPKTG